MSMMGEPDPYDARKLEIITRGNMLQQKYGGALNPTTTMRLAESDVPMSALDMAVGENLDLAQLYTDAHELQEKPLAEQIDYFNNLSPDQKVLMVSVAGYVPPDVQEEQAHRENKSLWDRGKDFVGSQAGTIAQTAASALGVPVGVGAKALDLAWTVTEPVAGGAFRLAEDSEAGDQMSRDIQRLREVRLLAAQEGIELTEPEYQQFVLWYARRHDLAYSEATSASHKLGLTGGLIAGLAERTGLADDVSDLLGVNNPLAGKFDAHSLESQLNFEKDDMFLPEQSVLLRLESIATQLETDERFAQKGRAAWDRVNANRGSDYHSSARLLQAQNMVGGPGEAYDFIVWASNHSDLGDVDGGGLAARYLVDIAGLDENDPTLGQRAALMTQQYLAEGSQGREAYEYLVDNNYRVSLGREYATLVGLDPGTGEWQTLSGAMDAAHIMLYDPLNALGGVGAGYRGATRGFRTVGELSSMRAMAREAAENGWDAARHLDSPKMSDIADDRVRRILDGTDSRLEGLLDEPVRTALVQGDTIAPGTGVLEEWHKALHHLEFETKRAVRRGRMALDEVGVIDDARLILGRAYAAEGDQSMRGILHRLRVRGAHNAEKAHAHIAEAFKKASGGDKDALRRLFDETMPHMRNVQQSLMDYDSFLRQIRGVGIEDADDIWRFWSRNEGLEALATGNAKRAGRQLNQMFTARPYELPRFASRDKAMRGAAVLFRRGARRMALEPARESDTFMRKALRLAAAPVRRPIKWAGRGIYYAGAQVPENTLAISGRDADVQFSRFVDAFSLVGNMSRKQAEEVKAAWYNAGAGIDAHVALSKATPEDIARFIDANRDSVADRIDIAQNFIKAVFNEAFPQHKRTADLDEWIDKTTNKLLSQRYSVDDLDVVGDTRVPIWAQGQHSLQIALPDWEDLTRSAENLTVFQRIMGYTVNHRHTDLFMKKFWKRSMLMRLGFPIRAGGEEGFFFSVRFGARAIPAYFSQLSGDRRGLITGTVNTMAQLVRRSKLDGDEVYRLVHDGTWSELAEAYRAKDRAAYVQHTIAEAIRSAKKRRLKDQDIGAKGRQMLDDYEAYIGAGMTDDEAAAKLAEKHLGRRDGFALSVQYYTGVYNAHVRRLFFKMASDTEKYARYAAGDVDYFEALDLTDEAIDAAVRAGLPLRRNLLRHRPELARIQDEILNSRGAGIVGAALDEDGGVSIGFRGDVWSYDRGRTDPIEIGLVDGQVELFDVDDAAASLRLAYPYEVRAGDEAAVAALDELANYVGPDRAQAYYRHLAKSAFDTDPFDVAASTPNPWLSTAFEWGEDGKLYSNLEVLDASYADGNSWLRGLASYDPTSGALADAAATLGVDLDRLTYALHGQGSSNHVKAFAQNFFIALARRGEGKPMRAAERSQRRAYALRDALMTTGVPGGDVAKVDSKTASVLYRRFVPPDAPSYLEWQRLLRGLDGGDESLLPLDEFGAIDHEFADAVVALGWGFFDQRGLYVHAEHADDVQRLAYEHRYGLLPGRQRDTARAVGLTDDEWHINHPRPQAAAGMPDPELPAGTHPTLPGMGGEDDYRTWAAQWDAEGPVYGPVNRSSDRYPERLGPRKPRDWTIEIESQKVGPAALQKMKEGEQTARLVRPDHPALRDMQYGDSITFTVEGWGRATFRVVGITDVSDLLQPGIRPDERVLRQLGVTPAQWARAQQGGVQTTTMIEFAPVKGFDYPQRTKAMAAQAEHIAEKPGAVVAAAGSKRIRKGQRPTVERWVKQQMDQVEAEMSPGHGKPLLLVGDGTGTETIWIEEARKRGWQIEEMPVQWSGITGDIVNVPENRRQARNIRKSAQRVTVDAYRDMSPSEAAAKFKAHRMGELPVMIPSKDLPAEGLSYGDVLTMRGPGGEKVELFVTSETSTSGRSLISVQPMESMKGALRDRNDAMVKALEQTARKHGVHPYAFAFSTDSGRFTRGTEAFRQRAQRARGVDLIASTYDIAADNGAAKREQLLRARNMPHGVEFVPRNDPNNWIPANVQGRLQIGNSARLKRAMMTEDIDDLLSVFVVSGPSVPRKQLVHELAPHMNKGHIWYVEDKKFQQPLIDVLVANGEDVQVVSSYASPRHVTVDVKPRQNNPLGVWRTDAGEEIDYFGSKRDGTFIPFDSLERAEYDRIVQERAGYSEADLGDLEVRIPAFGEDLQFAPLARQNDEGVGARILPLFDESTTQAVWGQRYQKIGMRVDRALLDVRRALKKLRTGQFNARGGVSMSAKELLTVMRTGDDQLINEAGLIKARNALRAKVNAAPGEKRRILAEKIKRNLSTRAKDQGLPDEGLTPSQVDRMLATDKREDWEKFAALADEKHFGGERKKMLLQMETDQSTGVAKIRNRADSQSKKAAKRFRRPANEKDLVLGVADGHEGRINGAVAEMMVSYARRVSPDAKPHELAAILNPTRWVEMTGDDLEIALRQYNSILDDMLDGMAGVMPEEILSSLRVAKMQASEYANYRRLKREFDHRVFSERGAVEIAEAGPTMSGGIPIDPHQTLLGMNLGDENLGKIGAIVGPDNLDPLAWDLETLARVHADETLPGEFRSLVYELAKIEADVEAAAITDEAIDALGQIFQGHRALLQQQAGDVRITRRGAPIDPDEEARLLGDIAQGRPPRHRVDMAEPFGEVTEDQLEYRALRDQPVRDVPPPTVDEIEERVLAEAPQQDPFERNVKSWWHDFRRRINRAQGDLDQPLDDELTARMANDDQNLWPDQIYLPTVKSGKVTAEERAWADRFGGLQRLRRLRHPRFPDRPLVTSKMHPDAKRVEDLAAGDDFEYMTEQLVAWVQRDQGKKGVGGGRAGGQHLTNDLALEVGLDPQGNPDMTARVAALVEMTDEDIFGDPELMAELVEVRRYIEQAADDSMDLAAQSDSVAQAASIDRGNVPQVGAEADALDEAMFRGENAGDADLIAADRADRAADPLTDQPLPAGVQRTADDIDADEIAMEEAQSRNKNLGEDMYPDEYAEWLVERDEVPVAGGAAPPHGPPRPPEVPGPAIPDPIEPEWNPTDAAIATLSQLDTQSLRDLAMSRGGTRNATLPVEDLTRDDLIDLIVRNWGSPLKGLNPLDELPEVGDLVSDEKALHVAQNLADYLHAKIGPAEGKNHLARTLRSWVSQPNQQFGARPVAASNRTVLGQRINKRWAHRPIDNRLADLLEAAEKSKDAKLVDALELLEDMPHDMRVQLVYAGRLRGGDPLEIMRDAVKHVHATSETYAPFLAEGRRTYRNRHGVKDATSNMDRSEVWFVPMFDQSSANSLYAVLRDGQEMELMQELRSLGLRDDELAALGEMFIRLMKPGAGSPAGRATINAAFADPNMQHGALAAIDQMAFRDRNQMNRIARALNGSKLIRSKGGNMRVSVGFTEALGMASPSSVAVNADPNLARRIVDVDGMAAHAMLSPAEVQRSSPAAGMAFQEIIGDDGVKRYAIGNPQGSAMEDLSRIAAEDLWAHFTNPNGDILYELAAPIGGGDWSVALMADIPHHKLPAQLEAPLIGADQPKSRWDRLSEWTFSQMSSLMDGMSRAPHFNRVFADHLDAQGVEIYSRLMPRRLQRKVEAMIQAKGSEMRHRLVLHADSISSPSYADQWRQFIADVDNDPVFSITDDLKDLWNDLDGWQQREVLEDPRRLVEFAEEAGPQYAVLELSTGDHADEFINGQYLHKALEAFDEDEITDLVRYLQADQEAQIKATEWAMLRAAHDVAPYIDDHRVRSLWASQGRNLMPFFFATEQFFKRWMRGIADDPRLLRRAQLAGHGFMSGVWIEQDQNGNDVFVIPGSESLNSLLANTPVVSRLFGAAPGRPISVQMTGRVDRMLPGIPGDLEKMPALSPIVQIPTSWAAHQFPELRKPYSDVFDQQPEVDIFGTVMPMWARRSLGAIPMFDVMNEKELASATISAMQLMESEAIRLNMEAEEAREAGEHAKADELYERAAELSMPSGSDAAEIDAYIDEVRTWARSQMVLRGVLGFASPAQPAPDWDEEGLRSEFIDMLATMPYEEALGAFLAMHPDGGPWTVMSSTSRSGAPLAPTEQAMAYLDENRAYLDQYELGGAWLLPLARSENAIDRAAYAEFMARGMRHRKSPEEWVNQYKFAAGAGVYFDTKAMYDAEIARRPQDKDALTQAWQVWSDGFKATHPLFEQELGRSGSNERGQALHELRIIIDDPTRPDFEHEEETRELLGVLDEFELHLAQVELSDRGDAPERRKQLREQFLTWGLDYLERNPHMEPMWRTLIVPAAGLRQEMELESGAAMVEATR